MRPGKSESCSGESEASAERCKQEVEELCAKYGIEAVREALDQINVEQPDKIEETKTAKSQPAVETESDPLDHLREILSRKDIPIYVNTRLDGGQKLFGLTSGDGYETFYFQMDDEESFKEVIEKTNIIYTSKIKMLPQPSQRDPLGTNGIAFVRMEDYLDDDKIIEFITYYVNKTDRYGRRCGSSFALILKPDEVDEIEKALSETDPNKVVDIILERIAIASDGGETLQSIAPHGDLTGAAFGATFRHNPDQSLAVSGRQKSEIKKF
ncbi:hypothetical protein COT78_03505 [Candidatus Berkelbacteria bacterium CG10_big_fil_rev_8_21_14_0_10_43_13]|uniref:Uncharacterized protein n=1 Tax=Candidatus Berkelbacteria bacterium CG10_big_fil_rev_8_21_14_0_10_43_13 TaxID=1974514 RepID=A0A2H0W7Z4_9BACT|nr:MAG: hypothetical protein COT78_03505 [Candidatus Berkelbacteria bacterium CG10_big_fil_rev_8_21_14_0_10_43_13]